MVGKVSDVLKIRNCFTKSIAFFILLKLFSYSPKLNIGVSKDNLNLKSHAWVEVSGIKINFEEVDIFKVITSIS